MVAVGQGCFDLAGRGRGCGGAFVGGQFLGSFLPVAFVSSLVLEVECRVQLPFLTCCMACLRASVSSFESCLRAWRASISSSSVRAQSNPGCAGSAVVVRWERCSFVLLGRFAASDRYFLKYPGVLLRVDVEGGPVAWVAYPVPPVGAGCLGVQYSPAHWLAALAAVRYVGVAVAFECWQVHSFGAAAVWVVVAGVAVGAGDHAAGGVHVFSLWASADVRILDLVRSGCGISFRRRRAMLVMVVSSWSEYWVLEFQRKAYGFHRFLVVEPFDPVDGVLGQVGVDLGAVCV